MHPLMRPSLPTVLQSPHCRKSAAGNTSHRVLFLFVLVLLSKPPPIEGFSFSYRQWRTLFSLAHSLMNRVANLRASRGDVAGSERARGIAEKLEIGMGLGFGGGMWSMGWDYLRNYAWTWRDLASMEMPGVVSDINELLRAVNEPTRLESDWNRVEWIRLNYQNVFKVSRSLFGRLLRMFNESGPLREFVVTVQREVEGDLLRDCLELGGNDLKGLIQIVKEMALQFSSSSYRDDL